VHCSCLALRAAAPALLQIARIATDDAHIVVCGVLQGLEEAAWLVSGSWSWISRSEAERVLKWEKGPGRANDRAVEAIGIVIKQREAFILVCYDTYR